MPLIILIIILALLVYAISPILTPFVLGVVLAYLLDPLVKILEKLKLSRSNSALIPVLLFFVAIGGLLTVAVPKLIEDVSHFVNNIPMYADWLEKALGENGIITTYLTSWGLEFDKSTILHQLYAYHDRIALIILEFLEKTAFSAMALVDIISLLVITPLVVFYFLKDWAAFLQKSLNLVPEKYRSDIKKTFSQMDIALSTFLRAQGGVCLLLGLFYGTSLSIYGLEMGFVIGLATGLLSFIPFAGMALGLITAFSVAVIQYHFGDYTPYAIIAGIFVVGQLLEQFFLTPKLIGEKVGLHPLWVIFAVMVGGELAGFLGVLIALPTATVMTVLLPKVVKFYSRQL